MTVRGEENLCSLLDGADGVRCVPVVVNESSTIPKVWGRFQTNAAAAVEIFLLGIGLNLSHCEISLRLNPPEEATKSEGTLLCSIAILLSF